MQVPALLTCSSSRPNVLSTALVGDLFDEVSPAMGLSRRDDQVVEGAELGKESLDRHDVLTVYLVSGERKVSRDESGGAASSDDDIGAARGEDLRRGEPRA
jgi:hypothetical protein